jgi:hypothetical protein
VLCVFYYDYYYPTHVMMLTRIGSPYCCVVLYDYINSSVQ